MSVESLVINQLDTMPIVFDSLNASAYIFPEFATDVDTHVNMSAPSLTGPLNDSLVHSQNIVATWTSNLVRR